MNRNIPHVLLILTFLFRIMFPVTNSFYFLSELTLIGGGLWHILYIVSLVPEVAAIAILAMGLQSPETRRIGAYITFALPGLHYAAALLLFIILPAARQFIGVVPMIVLTVTYAVTAALGYLTLRSADGTYPAKG